MLEWLTRLEYVFCSRCDVCICIYSTPVLCTQGKMTSMNEVYNCYVELVNCIVEYVLIKIIRELNVK